jgi:hypothetical protein
MTSGTPGAFPAMARAALTPWRTGNAAARAARETGNTAALAAAPNMLTMLSFVWGGVGKEGGRSRRAFPHVPRRKCLFGFRETIAFPVRAAHRWAVAGFSGSWIGLRSRYPHRLFDLF